MQQKEAVPESPKILMQQLFYHDLRRKLLLEERELF